METYEKYVGDSRHFDEFNEYVEKFKQAPRESDQRSVQITKEHGASGLKVLDIGCNTGNLLCMVREACPDAELHGVDLVESVIEANKTDERLEGITFDVCDIVREPAKGGPYDVILLNAVFMIFDNEAHDKAIENIAQCLKPGGIMVAFDVYNDFEQHLHTVETTRAFPDGIDLYFRPKSYCTSVMAEAGLVEPDYRRHVMQQPLELADYSQISSYTLDTVDGARLLFRGSIFQPWHHLVVKKAS